MKLVSRKKENLDMVSEFLERTWDMVSLKMALLGTWSKGWCSPYLDYIFYEKVPRLKSAKLKTQLRIKTSQLTYKKEQKENKLKFLSSSWPMHSERWGLEGIHVVTAKCVCVLCCVVYACMCVVCMHSHVCAYVHALK